MKLTEADSEANSAANSIDDQNPSRFSSSSQVTSSQVRPDPGMSLNQVTDILADYLDFFPKAEVPQLASHILKLSKKYQLDPALILSLIAVESSFRVRAVSPAGAIGLMQLMIPTANFVTKKLQLDADSIKKFHLKNREITEEELFDPFINITIGITYLAWLRDHYFENNPFHVFAAYNLGPTKLNSFLNKKSFRAGNTKKYYLSILRGVPEFRNYKRKI